MDPKKLGYDSRFDPLMCSSTHELSKRETDRKGRAELEKVIAEGGVRKMDRERQRRNDEESYPLNQPNPTQT